jgi:hypothetical protein
MAIESFFFGHVNGGRFYAIVKGAELADVQAFADAHKTADEPNAKLGAVTAYEEDKVIGEAEVIVLHNSDANGAKTLMVAAQAKVRAKLAGKVGGKRGGREIV